MRAFLTFVAPVLWALSASAVTIDMLPVGNPGNAPDTRYIGNSVGDVDHVYQIGKYEVTAGQYTEFLNAVAKTDPNSLYNAKMADISFDISNGFGANIQRTGSSPNYSYSVAADWADRPVNYVSFWDAARFANWLHNGQPTGAQGAGTTEDGAYHDVGNQTLFGAMPARNSSSHPRTSGTRRPITTRPPAWPPVTSTIRPGRTRRRESTSTRRPTRATTRITSAVRSVARTIARLSANSSCQTAPTARLTREETSPSGTTRSSIQGVVYVVAHGTVTILPNSMRKVGARVA